MSDEHFRAAFGLGASVTGAVMRDLRDAAAGIAAARTLEAMRSASGKLADALTAIDPSRLGQIIGGARAGVAKVDADNLNRMAGILQAEAGSDRDKPAMEGIGHTILNRMQRNGTALVADVAGGYARPKPPREDTVALARQVFDRTSVDPTGGATHFYSPQTMPKEGQQTRGDVGGGLEAVEGVTLEDGQTPRPQLQTGLGHNIQACCNSRHTAIHSQVLYPTGHWSCPLNLFSGLLDCSSSYAHVLPGRSCRVEDGFVLPNPTSFDKLISINREIAQEHCQTRACKGYSIAIEAYDVSRENRGTGGNVWFGSPPPWQTLYRQGGAKIDAVLYKHANRPFWPEICGAVVAIGQHDDFRQDHTTSIAAWSLDIARRITRPGTDCLGEVLKRLPPSPHRDVA